MSQAEFDLGLEELLAIQKPGESFTYEQMARVIGVKRQRIQAIENEALGKLARKSVIQRLYLEEFGRRPNLFNAHIFKRCAPHNASYQRQRRAAIARVDAFLQKKLSQTI